MSRIVIVCVIRFSYLTDVWLQEVFWFPISLLSVTLTLKGECIDSVPQLYSVVSNSHGLLKRVEHRNTIDYINLHRSEGQLGASSSVDCDHKWQQLRRGWEQGMNVTSKTGSHRKYLVIFQILKLSPCQLQPSQGRLTNVGDRCF